MPERGGSAPNPHALDAAARTSEHHCAKAIMLSAGEARWPLRIGRVWPGIAALVGPRLPVYDLNGGPDAVTGLADLRALLDAARQTAALPSLIAANAVTAEGPAWEALLALKAEKMLDCHVLTRWERALLDRAAAPDAEAYGERFLSAEQRKALRRKRRRLAESGELSLAIHADPGAIPAAFETFCSLEAQGWKGRAGSALTQDDAGRAYVADVMASMARADGSFIAVLTMGGQPLAAGLFLRAGGEIFFWKTAYDESHARLSPGVVFDLMLTEWLYEQPWFERLDAGHDDSVDPASLIWRQRRPMANILVDLAPSSLAGRLALEGLRLRGRLRSLKARYAAK